MTALLRQLLLVVEAIVLGTVAGAYAGMAGMLVVCAAAGWACAQHDSLYQRRGGAGT